VCVALPLSGFAAKPVDGAPYKLDIRHQLLSNERLADGRISLELQITLRNDGTHGLYDLRFLITQIGPFDANRDCAPLRVRELNAGAQDGVVWQYECRGTQLPDQSFRQLQLRVEAVDQSTQQIVSFTSTSKEGI
jgi:hypothetical protein